MLAASLKHEREDAWADILASFDYVINVLDYYRDGFESFRRQASRAHPEIDFSRFVFDDDSGSPVTAEVIEV